MSPRLIILACALAAMASVAGCGKRGTLDRADPMWGAPADGADAAADEGVNDDSDNDKGADRTRPYSTSKPLDPAQQDIPIREAPTGGPSDPYGQPNGGSPGA
jgi:hypothetical protein